MKNICFSFLMAIAICHVAAQENLFPNGVYLNLEQLKTRTPAFNANLTILMVNDENQKKGSDYKLTSNQDSLEKKFIKKSIYAYVKGDYLLLNAEPLGIESPYMRALTYGTFIAFYGGLTTKEINEAALLGGLVGAAIAGGSRPLYVLSLRTGNVRRLKEEYMTERLKTNPDLAARFASESDREDPDVLINYVRLLNEVTPLE